jgi:hypothetical protein
MRLIVTLKTHIRTALPTNVRISHPGGVRAEAARRASQTTSTSALLMSTYNGLSFPRAKSMTDAKVRTRVAELQIMKVIPQALWSTQRVSSRFLRRYRPKSRCYLQRGNVSIVVAIPSDEVKGQAVSTGHIEATRGYEDEYIATQGKEPEGD